MAMHLDDGAVSYASIDLMSAIIHSSACCDDPECLSRFLKIKLNKMTDKMTTVIII